MAEAKCRVLVLGGGPDSEREVSLRSAAGITAALLEAGYDAVNRTIERISADELEREKAEVIFPALHGGWGEGGPLQDILEADGRAFVGSGSRAARHAMDKLATKMTAARLGIPTPDAHAMDVRDPVCPLPLPAVIKPVHEGSTIGLHVCRDHDDWARARRTIDEERYATAGGDGRVYMIEQAVLRADGRKARELTAGILDGRALPLIEITPAVELYDFEAKYNRNDTRYSVAPTLPAGVTERVQSQTLALAKAMGVRHLARADFMLDDDGTAWFLEINTLPGFTDHSLVPMAAKHQGMPMPALCAALVEMARRDGGRA